MPAASSLILGLMAATAAATDAWRGKIPNALTYPGAVLGLVVATMEGGLRGLGMGVLGLVLGIAVLLPLFAKGGMGGGDVKLFGAIGALVGPWGLIWTFFASVLIGAVFSVALLVLRSELGRSLRSLGTFFSTLLMPGLKVTSLRTEARTKIRFGAAIALGALLYIAHRELGFGPTVVLPWGTL